MYHLATVQSNELVLSHSSTSGSSVPGVYFVSKCVILVIMLLCTCSCGVRVSLLYVCYTVVAATYYAFFTD